MKSDKEQRSTQKEKRMDFCINDAVVGFDSLTQRMVVGVIESIDWERQRTTIRTIEPSVGSNFEGYCLPLANLQRFNLNFFENCVRNGYSGDYYARLAEARRLRSELERVEKALKDYKTYADK